MGAVLGTLAVGLWMQSVEWLWAGALVGGIVGAIVGGALDGWLDSRRSK